MKAKTYFLSEHSNHELIHGAVGLVDIEKILLRMKAIPVAFPHHFNFSAKAKLIRLGFLVKLFFSIRKGATVVFLHPVYARMNMMLLRLLRLRRYIRIICIVTDIDGLKSGSDELLAREKHLFKRYKHFIVHNENMRAWLLAFHPSANCSVLRCFDFLAGQVYHKPTKSNYIAFAGNLQKSLFLEELHTWLTKNSSVHVNLYGPYVTDAMLVHPQVKYKGLHNPYSLPNIIEGSFGLIWDGDSVNEPGGSLGHYMQYISHHKLSLYIVSNLPVIVHESAGCADLVRKLKLGITVKSLFEVEQKILNLSDADYATMVDNTRQLAREITAGNHLQSALKELLNETRDR